MTMQRKEAPDNNTLLAWLFVNNIAMALITHARARSDVILPTLRETFAWQADYSQIGALIKQTLVGADYTAESVLKSVMTFLDQPQFSELGWLKEQLVHELGKKKYHTKLANDIFNRMTNLKDSTDVTSELNDQQQFDYLSNSSGANDLALVVYPLALFPDIQQLSDRVYLTPTFEVTDTTPKEAMLAYLSAMLSPGKGAGDVGVVLSLDHVTNTLKFDALFKSIKPYLKGTKPPFETDRFDRVQAMKSFYKTGIGLGGHDPRLSATEADSFVYEIEDPRQPKPGSKMGTLKLFNYDTQHKPSAVLVRVWLLSRIQPVCIQVKDPANPQQLAEAVAITLTFKVLDAWAETRFDPTTFAKKVASILQANDGLRTALSDVASALDPDAPKEAARLLVNQALNTALVVYKQLPASQVKPAAKDLPVDLSVLVNSPVHQYVAEKNANMQKAQRKVVEADRSQHYHKVNTPPYDKKLRHEEISAMLDELNQQHGLAQLPLTAAINLALVIQAALSDAVEYIERKQGGTMKQGKAVGSLKATYEILITAIATALKIDPKEFKIIQKQKSLVDQLDAVLAKLLANYVQQLPLRCGLAEQTSPAVSTTTASPMTTTTTSPAVSTTTVTSVPQGEFDWSELDALIHAFGSTLEQHDTAVSTTTDVDREDHATTTKVGAQVDRRPYWERMGVCMMPGFTPQQLQQHKEIASDRASRPVASQLGKSMQAVTNSDAAPVKLPGMEPKKSDDPSDKPGGGAKPFSNQHH